MIRFRLNTLLVLTALTGVALTFVKLWVSAHDDAFEREYDLFYQETYEVAEISKCILPNWIPYAPMRITALDFVATDIHYRPTEQILHYNQFRYVDTIRIGHHTRISDRVLQALKTYPRLKTVLVDVNSRADVNDIRGGTKYHDIPEHQVITEIEGINFIPTPDAFYLIYEGS